MKQQQCICKLCLATQSQALVSYWLLLTCSSKYHTSCHARMLPLHMRQHSTTACGQCLKVSWCAVPNGCAGRLLWLLSKTADGPANGKRTFLDHSRSPFIRLSLQRITQIKSTAIKNQRSKMHPSSVDAALILCNMHVASLHLTEHHQLELQVCLCQGMSASSSGRA